MQKNKKGYTIIVVILIIGFLMVLTVGILNVIMGEMRDNTLLGNYSKAYIGAESAQELALLNLKNIGMGYNEDSVSLYQEKIFGNSPKDSHISYTTDGSVKEYVGTIDGYSYQMIPLFTLQKDGNNVTEKKISAFQLSLQSGTEDKLAWNILAKDKGISGVGGITSTTRGKLKEIHTNDTDFEVQYDDTQNINTFLHDNTMNYLILFNSGDEQIQYKMQANETFTSPEIHILSSGKIAHTQQNILTTVKFDQIFSKAKYSIYSGN